MSAPDTAWASGRFGGPQQPQLLFGHMFEDWQIELEAFAPGPRRVFCIASAGCTAMALRHAGHDVVACDINPVQLAYAERRLAGGTLESGVVDRTMSFVRQLSPLAGWRKSLVREFLSMTDPTEQLEFWSRHLDTWRFRTAFDVILSRALLRRVYSERLLASAPRNFGAVVRQRMERGFARHANASNPYPRALLAGEWVDDPPPASGVELVLSDAAAYLESCSPGQFGGFTLSNILDGAGPAYRARLAAAMQRAAAPGAVFVLRSFGEPAGNSAANQAEQDRALLWGLVQTGVCADGFCDA